MPRKRTIPLAEHFWAKVEKTSRCWIWRASHRPKGYGTYYINRVPKLAHRVAWELTIGPIPEGMWVLHHCDNPPCVRPAHLFLGTAARNIDDAQRKGHMAISMRVRGRGRAFGERSAGAKLTEQKVRDARAEYRRGVHIRTLARRYGVSDQAMRSALVGKTWKHVPLGDR